MHKIFRAISGFWVLLLLSVLALGSTQAIALEFLGNKTIAGSGHAASVKRELETFHQISINLPGTIELVQGNSENIVVEADDNLLPLLETVVKSGELTIRTAKGVRLARGSKIKFTLSVRTLDGLSLAGSADLTSTHLQAPRFKLNISGAGSINIQNLQSDNLSIGISGSGQCELGGTAKSQDITIAGTGNVKTARLSAQDVNVNISGTGNATVWVQHALSISIEGSGDVRYYGAGTVKEQSISGSGRVRLLGAAPPPPS